MSNILFIKADEIAQELVSPNPLPTSSSEDSMRS
jgi:hypothetical protein